MSNQLNLAFVIKTKLDGVLSDFKAIKNRLQQVNKENNRLGRQTQATEHAFAKLSNRFIETGNKAGEVRSGIESISKQLLNLQRIYAGWQGIKFFGTGLSDIAKTADSFNNYQSRIALVSRSNAEAKSTFQSLMAISNETGKSFEATAELYTRVFRSLGQNVNRSDLLNFTKTVQQALTISGASTQEAQAALIQLSQGLSAGALRGEEFNSVAEQAPILLDLMQKSLGKTRAELRKLAEQGKLTTEVVMAAVREGAQDIDSQYQKMPKTIGRAVNELSNAWLTFVGQTDNTFSASGTVSRGISFLAENLNTLATGALTLAGVALIRYVVNLRQTQQGLSRLSAMMLRVKGVTVAQAAIDVKAAQSALVAAKATDQRTAATLRLAQAQQRLNLLQQSVRKGTGLGGMVMGFFGGGFGLALTAISGLVVLYQALQEKERALAAQYQNTLQSLDQNIEKTNALIKARKQLSRLSFVENRGQLATNTHSLQEVEKQLNDLQAQKRMQQHLYDSALENGGLTFGFTDRLAKIDEKITALTERYQKLKQATQTLSDVTDSQLVAAFNQAKQAGGELAEKLANISDAKSDEAIALLTPVIKKAENQLREMNTQLDQTNTKLAKDLKEATTTAKERLQAMRTEFANLGKQAGLSTAQLDPFLQKLDKSLVLTDKLAAAKKQAEGKKYLASLKTQAARQGLNERQRIVFDAKEKGLTGKDLQLAKQYAAIIAKRPKYSHRKDEYHALQLRYLKATGQQVKANLLDVESRFNQLLVEFQQTGNTAGVALIKKLLPLEQAKAQLDGIQAQLNQRFNTQAADEASINAQLQAGTISQIEAQQRLKGVYTETVAEIQKQLPLLEKLAQLPGAQGEQARVMLTRMQVKLTELKSVGDELTKTFQQGLTQGIQSSLMGLANGTMTLKDAIKNLALTVVNAMAQIAAQQLAMQAVSAVGSAFSSGAGAAVTAATGGYISGPGTGTSDSIPARLSNGEFVIRAASVSRYGVDFLHALNRGKLRKFNKGGLVSSPNFPKPKEPTLTHELKEGMSQQKVAVSPVNIQQTLAVDSAELFTSGINTVAGERAVLTVIRANKQTIKQELG